MAESVIAFLGQDLKQLAQTHDDFTEHKQSELRKAMKQCSTDFEYPLDKPYDTEHDNFKFFALCLRNQVYLNPVLNQSKGVRQSVLGLHF